MVSSLFCPFSVGRLVARRSNDSRSESVAMSRAVYAPRRPSHRSQQRMDVGRRCPTRQGREKGRNLRLDRHRQAVFPPPNGRHVHETLSNSAHVEEAAAMDQPSRSGCEEVCRGQILCRVLLTDLYPYPLRTYLRSGNRFRLSDMPTRIRTCCWTEPKMNWCARNWLSGPGIWTDKKSLDRNTSTFLGSAVSLPSRKAWPTGPS